jgi:hypothetical protein
MSKEPVKQDDKRYEQRQGEEKPDDRQRREQAQQQGGSAEYKANLENAVSDMDRMRMTDPLFIEKTKAEDPSGRPGQITRDNVNPNIPSADKERLIDECGRVDPNAGGIVDPNSLGMPQGGVAAKTPPTPDELRTQREAEAKEGTVSPREGSINEPPGSNVLGKTEEDVPDEIKQKGKPVLTSLEPDEAVSGEPDFTLVISGDNFFSGSVIVFGDHDEPTTFDEEAGTVSTGVKPSLFAPATVPVKVRNGSMVSDPMEFEFTAPAGTRGGEEEDPDDLEDEIDQMKEDGDISSRKPKGRKK